jgi:alcohol dehydrogenase
MPRLARYGISEADVPKLVAVGRGGSTRTNPIALSDQEMAKIVTSRL